VMDEFTGAVLGSVPNTVINTEDGCVLSDGTMGVQQRPLHVGDGWNFYIYDKNWNQIAIATPFSGENFAFTPSPVSDFSSTFYASNPNRAVSTVRAISKTGALGATIGPLAALYNAFCVSTDGSTLYYWSNTTFNLETWNIPGNSAGPTLFPRSSFPSGV